MTDPVGRWIELRAAIAPDAPALAFEGESESYAMLAARVAATAATLAREFRVRPGDRVAALMRNRPEFLALFFACARLGAIFQPLNWRLAPPELAFQLGHAGAAVLIVEGAFLDAAAALRDRLAGTTLVVLDGLRAGWLPWPASEGGDAANDVDEAAPCLLVYTSGTTGRPKGALLSHRALCANAAAAEAGFALVPADRVLTFLPMFHVGGLNIQTTPALRAGACVSLQPRFEPDAALAAIARERPTLTLVVPAVMQALISHPAWGSADLSSLRAVGAGSSIVPPALIEAFHARGVPVQQVYGATETAPTVTVLARADATAKIGSCGRPALGCELRVVRDDATATRAGERGEIEVRGATVTSGYWRDEGATRAAFTSDGWFMTGDIGHRDEDGFLWIDDRKQDLIVSGGENVYPAEVEAVLAAHQAVAQCAVVARPDPRWGEVPVAVVALKPGATLGADAALALFEGRLARFKHPREIVFMDALPETALGKVEKFRLREILRGG